MRAIVLLALLLYAASAVQVSILAAPPITVSTPVGRIGPDLLLLIAVLAGLLSRRNAAFPLFIAAGVLSDLTSTWPAEGQGVLVLLGPYTLGYIAAWFTLLHFRQVLVRHHPLAAVLCTVACGAAVHLVALAILRVRSFYELQPGFSPNWELLRQAGCVIYTAALTGLVALIPPIRNVARARRAPRWATN